MILLGQTVDVPGEFDVSFASARLTPGNSPPPVEYGSVWTVNRCWNWIFGDGRMAMYSNAVEGCTVLGSEESK